LTRRVAIVGIVDLAGTLAGAGYLIMADRNRGDYFNERTEINRHNALRDEAFANNDLEASERSMLLEASLYTRLGCVECLGALP
jgi:hypothetical protein